jgi:hypothetical protein
LSRVDQNVEAYMASVEKKLLDACGKSGCKPMAERNKTCFGMQFAVGAAIQAQDCVVGVKNGNSSNPTSTAAASTQLNLDNNGSGSGSSGEDSGQVCDEKKAFETVKASNSVSCETLGTSSASAANSTTTASSNTSKVGASGAVSLGLQFRTESTSVSISQGSVVGYMLSSGIWSLARAAADLHALSCADPSYKNLEMRTAIKSDLRDFKDSTCALPILSVIQNSLLIGSLTATTSGGANSAVITAATSLANALCSGRASAGLTSPTLQQNQRTAETPSEKDPPK